jgi:hypothetical protein
MTAANTILKSKWTWIIAAVLIAAYVLNKNGSRWYANLTRKDQGNYQGQEAVQSNPAREAELQKMAQNAYSAINGIPGFDRDGMLLPLLSLNDTELRYVATFYAKNVQPDGSSLKENLQDEWLLGDTGDQLIAKLTQLAL